MSERESMLETEERKSSYKIHGWRNEIINIPKYSQITTRYSATLGHKANHEKIVNAEFRFIEHPRFGEIVGLFMVKNAVAGEEVVVDYGYIEKYMATEAGIKMMLEAAQAMSGITNKEDFKRKMKSSIGFEREKVTELKPILNTLKKARNLLSQE